jgi:biotin carboxylase
VLLLPSATYRAGAFLAAARVLGAEVVVASEVPQALAGAMGDRSLVVPLDDPRAAATRIAAHARHGPIDAVVGVDDNGVVAAALAAELLGLVHSPAAAVAITRDKAALRARLAAAHVPQPRFRVIERGDDPGPAGSAVGWPVVVKPIGLSASQGVIRVDRPADLSAAVDRVRGIARRAGSGGEEPLLVEQFVSGAEVALEGLMVSGSFEALALFDKPDALDGPYFEETLYVTPSRLPPDQRARAEEVTAAAAEAIGLTEGPVHAEVRLDQDRAVVLEVAARSIGGLCSRALRFGAGISLESVILRHALGLPLDDLERADAASGVMMMPIPATGVLRAVDGVDAARAVEGMVGVEVSVARGRAVQALPEGGRYLGFLFARGDDPAAVERALRRAHRHLDITIEPGEQSR